MKNPFHKGWCRALLLLVMLSCARSFALRHVDHVLATQQPTTITGKVSFSGMPLPGATITVKGTTIATVSNNSGAYSISAGPSDVLIFSYTGFTTVEIPVNGRQVVDAELKEDATALKEVTVNAGYYSVKDRERTGSIAKVTSKDIEKQPVTEVLAALQGRVAGVSITQESGLAGSGFNIMIRGVNSLRGNGNAPLYVIDGVPYSADPISHNLLSLAIPGDGNPLSSINPSDIESVEILKDADATAIYGSRGANGVVLITTKRGKAGKTSVTVTSSYGFGRVTRMMKLMNTEQYLLMRNQAFANDGVAPEFWDYDVNGTWDQTRYTDWQKELIGGVSEIQSLQASVTGGNESTRFLLSGNNRSETTVFPGDAKYRRGGAHVSFDHFGLDKKFTVSFSGGYTVQHNKLPGLDFTTLSRQLAPNAPALYDENGNLNWENSTWENPLAQLEGENLTDTYDLVANSVLGYRILDGLEFKANLGYTSLKNDESRTYPSTMYDPAYQVGAEYSNIYLNSVARRSWTVEPQLNWKRRFGKSKLEALTGTTFQQQQSAALMQVGIGFSSNALIHDLASANVVQVRGNDAVVYRYQALFGRINYAYDDRLLLNFTGRRDGSSRFGPGRQFANFGAVGAAWIFSRERWLSGSALSFGKLRASYGTTGNDQIGDYQFLDTYGSSGYDYQGVSGITPIRLYNPNFGWETNRKLEVAVETGFFNDRLFFTGAWYRNRSSNQLVGQPLSATTGFTTIQSNLGATVQNSGLEFTLRGAAIQKEHFSWVASFNLTVPQSKLLSFPGLETSAYRNTYAVGEPVTIKKVYHFTGVDPSTGLYTFQDANGDGTITSRDRVAIKDLAPQYFGGLQNQFSYRGLQLDFLFQFVRQLNYNYAAGAGYGGFMRNQPVEYINSWSGPGDVAQHQLFTTGYNQEALQATEQYAQSDAAISDASFIRLKNIALSYDIPSAMLGGIRCRLTVQAQNLLTFTHYRGADPEFRSIGYLPPLRVISSGVQLTF